jgi:hypothetical protein
MRTGRCARRFGFFLKTKNTIHFQLLLDSVVDLLMEKNDIVFSWVGIVLFFFSSYVYGTTNVRIFDYLINYSYIFYYL